MIESNRFLISFNFGTIPFDFMKSRNKKEKKNKVQKSSIFQSHIRYFRCLHQFII